MSKENFKAFVKKHPSLINYVAKGEMTWQKFYEMYDLYGESNDAWSKFIEEEAAVTTSSLLGDTSLKEIFNMVKKIDLASVQKGVDGLQKAVHLIQDFTGNKTGNQNSYQRRPMYQYFED